MNNYSLENIRKNSVFLQLNLFFSTLLMLTFLYYNRENSFEVTLFLIASAISTIATIYLIVYLFSRFFFRFKITCFLMGVLFFIINFSLFFDFIIYKIWKFHINAMVLNIITSPAAYDSLNVTISTQFIILSIILILIILEIFLCNFLKSREMNFLNLKTLAFKKWIIPLILITILGEKFVYGVSDIFAKRNILESVKVIPLYQPLTFSKLAYKFGIKKVINKSEINSINKSSKINYPLSKINIDKNAPIPNIFIFMFDAVRGDIIDKDTTPNIINFSKDSIVFKNHISGGDATRFGVFSLFYSLNSTYWFNFLDAHKEPVFFDILKKRGYQIKIISSTDTRWPEFRQTIYSGLDDDDILDHAKGDSFQKDNISQKNFSRFLDEANLSKPIFTFTFLDAPHAYSYPKGFEKFKPNSGSEGVNYISATKESADEFKNSYKNATYYDDNLFSIMIKKIKESKLYDNSIIIFTSDHGEEFFEYGSFGHNSSFSKAQINSPFILKLPTNKHKVITKMTSHLDVIPTLLNILGVKNPPSDYSNGYNLFDPTYDREFSYIAKWNKNAISTDKFTYIFSNYPNEIFKNEIRENCNYKRVSKKDVPSIENILIKVLDQNRKFLK